MAQNRQPHTDVSTNGWVRHVPDPWRPFLLLARLDRPVGTWLLFLPGLWAIILARPSLDLLTLRLVILFAFGALVMRSAGCIVNDIWDRDIDAKVARTAMRPLASCQVSVRQAFMLLAGLLACGAAVLFQLPEICWALAPLALLLVGVYPLAKRVTWWPQLVMGFTFGFGAPMGYAAAAGRLDMTALILYAGTIFWQLGFDTIYGFQDMEDDARIGVKSTSRLWQSQARPFVAVCYSVASLFFALSAIRGGVAWPFWPVAFLASLLLVQQVLTLETNDPPRCLKLFKRNVPFGIILAVAFVAGRAV